MKVWHALDIRSHPDMEDAVLGWLAEQDLTGIEEPEPGRWVAHRAAVWDVDAAARELIALHRGAGFPEPRVSGFETREADWLAEWKAGWQPTPMGERLWVVPAWMDAAPVPEGRTAVRVDPGMAFGTGTHETTQLAWLLLEELLAEGLPHPATMLDLGTGTGVLALGAVSLCPGLRVMATETDADALRSAEENLALNGASPAFGVARLGGARLGDAPVRADEAVGRVWLVLSEGVPVRNGWAGAAVVNMTHAEHGPVREALLPALAPGAQVVLSGLFPPQAREAEIWWKGHGFQAVSRKELGEWAAMRLRGPAAL